MTCKVCIGMPVYNEEAFLRNALDSLLAQTHADFELIISDNASTDLTQKICQEYATRDERIKYIRQKSNIGIFANFEFVLRQCNCKYFMWAAADDYWLPTFLERNVQILETKADVVGTISKVAFYEDPKNPVPDVKIVRPIPTMIGTYQENASLCLRFLPGPAIYGVFRTNELKKRYIHKPFWGYEVAIILDLLKVGGFYVIDDILMYRYNGSRSARRRTIVATLLQNNVGFLDVIFASFPLTNWCVKNLGVKVFLKNIISVLKLNLTCEYAVILELIRNCKCIILGQERLF